MSKTADQVRADWRAKGLTMKEWANTNGFPITAVKAVMSGHNKGHFGQAHRIKVALGMKGEDKYNS
jgi:gp16 family phage-associated protein